MNDTIYSNFTNYIYKTDKLPKNEYLLFNPSIHYWIMIDSIGKEIYELIANNNSLNKTKKELIKKYNIDDDIFNNDVIPFVENLLNKRFLSTVKTEKEETFLSEKTYLDNINAYPFNEIYISLTNKCNLNCIYCFNKDERNKAQQDKNYKALSLKDYSDVIIQFKKLKGERVVFTGGEPTLYENFAELCKFASEHGLLVSFITNGLNLIECNFDEIFPYVTSVGISIDSLVQSELDSLWGVKDSKLAEKILNVLDKIDKWSEANTPINVTIMPISCALNHNSLKFTIDLISKKLSHCYLSWQITKYDKIDKDNIDNLLNIDEEKYRESIRNGLSAIADLSNPKEKLKVERAAYSRSGRARPSIVPKLYTCAPSFYIDTQGNISPCQGLDKIKIGNIKNMSLTEAFESEEFSQVHRIICKNDIDECKECELRFVCEPEKRSCVKSCQSSRNDCRDRLIYQMYLELLNTEY